jgi:voltage-gated potassium channel
MGYAQRSLTRRHLTARRAAQFIAAATLFVTIASGLLAWLIDKKDFGSLGNSMWWAVQTVTTVGYGDVVPRNTLGKFLGAFLMLNGIAFLTVITAAVTAMLIEQARQRRADSEQSLMAKLEQIESRLEGIEGRIGAGRDNG